MLQRQSACGKAGAERCQHGRFGKAFAANAIKHEQHRGGRHVAVRTQHGALVIKRSLAARLRALSIASTTLAPPGWQMNLSTSLSRQALRGQHFVNRFGKMAAREGGYGAVKHDTKAAGFDFPAHDIKRASPGLFGVAGDLRRSLPDGLRSAARMLRRRLRTGLSR